MQALDEGGEPNFNDADYQPAAYAAALKILTQYGNINGRDVEHEVFAVRSRNEKSKGSNLFVWVEVAGRLRNCQDHHEPTKRTEFTMPLTEPT